MPRQRGKRLHPVALDEAIRRHPDGPTTKSQVALGIGISPGALSDLISGRRRAADDLADDLADFLKVPREILFPEFGPFIEDPTQVVERAS